MPSIEERVPSVPGGGGSPRVVTLRSRRERGRPTAWSLTGAALICRGTFADGSFAFDGIGPGSATEQGHQASWCS